MITAHFIGGPWDGMTRVIPHRDYSIDAPEIVEQTRGFVRQGPGPDGPMCAGLIRRVTYTCKLELKDKHAVFVAEEMCW